MPQILATIFARWTGPRVDDEYRPAGTSDAVRVLLSLFAALAVAIAESFLYVFYIGKIERAKVKERKFKERKVLVQEIDGDAETVEDVTVSIDEKEKIWGKGVNGGVRRRVREKWEKENDNGAQGES
jgi:hypothetical protein